MRDFQPRSSVRAAGFTLVEILIVVAILGILAALVMPKLTTASESARETSLRDDLRYLRTQIMVYRAQHNGVAPGYPGGNVAAAPTYDALVAQLTQHSGPQGNTSANPGSQYKLGPYLLSVPVNPVNGSSEVRFVAPGVFPAAPGGPEGWVYQPATGTLAANVGGTDTKGTKYYDY